MVCTPIGLPISAHSLIALSRCSKSPSKVLDISVLQDLRHHGKCTLAFRLGRTHHPVSERFGHFEKRPSILHLLLGFPRANPSARVCLFAAGHLLPAGDFSPLLMFRLHFSHLVLA